ncbi:IdeS/Mac family cysteine endopeptidase [Streptococcus castoreus]|uniref:IdeS/Mac family cysteine endopeptidase n=1 Tax=Streptococcus castoreus TaxID=254786 RepID=UPI0003FF35B7|nr:IdeS/Mac family cysteine endopeptidase [Streptococcus castoreus]
MRRKILFSDLNNFYKSTIAIITIISSLLVLSTTIQAETSKHTISKKDETLHQNNLSISKTATSVWTTGVTPITSDQLTNYQNDVFRYPYTPNQGWYDITKTFNGRDNLLCGAATAGNMLHWWFDQNKEEIENYLLKYPEKQKIMFNNEEMFDLRKAINTKDSQKESALFSYFRDKAFPYLSARYLGVMPDHVLDMFINGYYLNVTKLDPTDVNRPNQTKDMRGGIFDAVFTRGDQHKLLTGRHPLSHLSLKEISDLIKQELQSGKALTLSHTYANVRLAHVINIWGADFDNEGNLIAIYVTDSDSDEKIGMKRYYVGRNNRSQGVRISAKEITDDNIGAQMLILFTLSSGKELWKK